MTKNVTAIVLAGGKGIRLGQDKVTEKLGNRSLLEQVICRISILSNEVIIVTAKERDIPDFTHQTKLRVITDIFPGAGPLGGIYTGLMNSESLYNLVVACDMPLLNRQLLSHMLSIAPGHDAVVPRLGRMVEPLHAVYSRSCLAPMENMLRNGDFSVYETFNRVRVRYLEREEIDRFDPEHLSFFNINTRDDLTTARKMFAGTDCND